MDATEIEHRINFMRMQIEGIQDELQKHRDNTLYFHDLIAHVSGRLNEYMKDNDEIRDVIGEKLFMMFYRVFPEAADADDALKRIVKAQKKKPKE